LLDGSWLCLKILRSLSCCERKTVDINTKFKYRGLSGAAVNYEPSFFLAAGMKEPTLLKVMKYTTGMRQLQPDNEEVALIASIVLFTPTRRHITKTDDMQYIYNIQQMMVRVLEKKMNRDPLRKSKLKDFLIGIAEIRTLVEEHVNEYNQFVNFQPKIVCAAQNPLVCV